MSIEDDDVYFENFSPFDAESRPAPRVQATPKRPSFQPQQIDDDTYFSTLNERGLSALPEPQRDEPTVRIPQALIQQLASGVRQETPTKVEHRADGSVARMSGNLDLPANPAPQNRGGFGRY